MTSSKFSIALCILEHVTAPTSILSQLLQKVDIDLKTAVDCRNNLQSLMKSCRDISNNDTYDEIYQKKNHLRIIISTTYELLPI